ncbi:MAG: response regulator [Candidatus Andersenbacteria bacterium]
MPSRKQPKRQKTILIAEDEPALSRVLSERVRGLGYKVLVARDGEQAIEQCRTGKPDLVLLDIIMPKKSGFDVLEALRAQLKSHVPVIVLSNLNRPTDIETAKNFEVTKYLTKSDVSLRDIVADVRRTLEG